MVLLNTFNMCFFPNLHCQISTFNFLPCSGRLLQDLGPGCRSSKDGKNVICQLKYSKEAYLVLAKTNIRSNRFNCGIVVVVGQGKGSGGGGGGVGGWRNPN